jgi:hypothetical protein
MTQNSKWYGKWLDVQADRDRLAARCRELEAALAENARLRAANKRLTYLLGHVLKNGRLEDDEMADARAALADSGPGGEEEA